MALSCQYSAIWRLKMKINESIQLTASTMRRLGVA